MPDEAFKARLDSEVLQHVFSCWQKARIDRRAPDWSAVASLQDPAIADHVFGWRVDPPTSQLVCFIMGPRPRELYGRDALGCTLAQFYGQAAGIVDSHMRQVIDGPALQHASGIIAWRERRTDLGERIVLPIRYASDVRPDGVIGATVFDYTMLGAIAPAAPPEQDICLIPLDPEADGA